MIATTLAELPRAVCAAMPGKTALTVDEERMTYEQLERRSNAIAHALVGQGVKPGDRVAVLARDGIRSVPLLFGAAKARVVWTGLNGRLSADELTVILDDARPAVLFFDPELGDLLGRTLERAQCRPALVTLGPGDERAAAFEVWLGGASEEPPAASYNADEVVVQLYTSGTTGQPKGVELASRSFFAVPREMAARGRPFLGWTSDDVSLLFVPTFHVAGLWWLVRGLALGSTTVLLRGFEPGKVLGAIGQHRVTLVGMVPAMMQVLLGEPSFGTADLSSLRTIFYGGSPIATPLLERALAAFPCELCQAYGMTETGNIAVCLGPEDHRPDRLLAAGKPLPGVEVRILRRDGSAAATGERGEIAVRSPARMVGYWNQPEATRATLVDGWVMTGDAGYLDDEGFLYVCDRLKDMIISAGENIYPAELENVLRTHPAVADVAVIGVPHELWGESILAFVVPRPGAEVTPRDVALHLRAHLASHKAPGQVEIVAQLPRNASGKVLKTKLREPYWRGQTRTIG